MTRGGSLSVAFLFLRGCGAKLSITSRTSSVQGSMIPPKTFHSLTARL